MLTYILIIEQKVKVLGTTFWKNPTKITKYENTLTTLKSKYFKGEFLVKTFYIKIQISKDQFAMCTDF